MKSNQSYRSDDLFSSLRNTKPPEENNSLMSFFSCRETNLSNLPTIANKWKKNTIKKEILKQVVETRTTKKEELKRPHCVYFSEIKEPNTCVRSVSNCSFWHIFLCIFSHYFIYSVYESIVSLFVVNLIVHLGS